VTPTKKLTGTQGAIGCLSLIATTVACMVIYGITLARLYAWFVVPTMRVRPIGIAEAIGLSTIATLLGRLPKDPTEEEKQQAAEHPWRSIALGPVRAVSACSTALVIGWICHRLS